MGKFSSIVLGALSGAAVAIYLNSEKGKVVREKATDFLNELKENPEGVRDNFVQSAHDFSDQAVAQFNDVKGKVQSGEINADTVVEVVRSKSQDAVAFSTEKFQEIKDLLANENLSANDIVEQVKSKVSQGEEIVIEMDDEAVLEEEPAEEEILVEVVEPAEETAADKGAE